MKINALIVVVAVVAFGSAALFVRNMAGKHDPSKIELVKAEWTPPKTTIDAGYIAAAKDLLGNGLADPRGGKFSKVQIEIGDAAWNRLDPKEAYGWVSNDGKRAVLLDGLEYPVTGQFTPADLDSVMMAEAPGPRNMPSGIRISPSSPAVPALLLLVGRVDLAEKEFEAAMGHLATTPSQILLDHMRQRYQMQTAQALMSRKDAEGLQWAKDLVRVAMIQEKSPQKPRFGGAPNPEHTLEPAQALYADIQRRVDHPKKDPVDVEAIKKLGESKRIDALIDALDTVAAHQMGQPGGVDYMDDPVCKAISEQGKAVVPPLIDAIESDKRVTRTVSFGRDFFPERSIHTVKGVAWNLLEFVWPSAEALQTDATKIPNAGDLRKAWNEQKGMSEEERWLAVLKDDNAGERKWLEAAESLVMPVGEVRHGFTYYNVQGPGSTMKGETLRAGHNAEVAAVMSKRALQICDVPTNGGMNMFACDDALRLGHCLAKWDPMAGAKCLKGVCTKCIEVMSDRSGGTDANRLGRFFAYAIADRAKTHDSEAAADFAKYCVAMDPSQGFLDDQCLRPLWEVPDDLGIQAVGKRLMANWTERLGEGGRMAASIAQVSTRLMPASPLLEVQSYRDFLAAAVLNEKELGTIQIRDMGGRSGVTYKLPSGGSGTWNLAQDEDPKSFGSDSISLSVGDYFAQALSNGFVKGFPPFHILWPKDKREKAKADLANWLKDQKRDWISVAKSSGFYRTFE